MPIDFSIGPLLFLQYIFSDKIFERLIYHGQCLTVACEVGDYWGFLNFWNRSSAGTFQRNLFSGPQYSDIEYTLGAVHECFSAKLRFNLDVLANGVIVDLFGGLEIPLPLDFLLRPATIFCLIL